MFVNTRTYLQADECPTCQVGGNVQDFNLGKYSDLVLHEVGTTSNATAYQEINCVRHVWDLFTQAGQDGCKDTETLPLTKMVVKIQDSIYALATATSWQPFEIGRRGPMAALSIYYIHANENTLMFYSGYSSPALYVGVDDYYAWEATNETTLAVNRNALKDSTIKIITVNDSSVFTGNGQVSIVPNSTVNITNIATDGTITVASNLPGGAPGTGTFIYITGTSEPTFNDKWCEVNPTGTLTVFKCPSLAGGGATGGTAQRQGNAAFFRLGSLGEYVQAWRGPGNTLVTEYQIHNNYVIGDPVWITRRKFVSTSPNYPLDRIMWWGYWFPAMGVDVGVPDVAGWNNGNRWGNASGAGEQLNDEYEWISAARPFDNTYVTSQLKPNSKSKYRDTSYRTGLIRRSYTKAEILHHVGWGLTLSDANLAMMQAYANVINFSDATLSFSQSVYYPINAWGENDNSICDYTGKTVMAGTPAGADYRTADGGCSAIRLRAWEGAVLMKEKVP